MARIPDDELQRIKSQVKVEDLCREYGIELKRMTVACPAEHSPARCARRWYGSLRTLDRANQLRKLWNRYHRQRELRAARPSQSHHLAGTRSRINHYFGKLRLRDLTTMLRPRYRRKPQLGPPPVECMFMATIGLAPNADRFTSRLLGRDPLSPRVRQICLHCCIHAKPPSGSHDAESVQRIKGAVGRTHTKNGVIPHQSTNQTESTCSRS
jgi:hypothetical protein